MLRQTCQKPSKLWRNNEEYRPMKQPKTWKPKPTGYAWRWTRVPITSDTQYLWRWELCPVCPLYD